MTPWFTGPSVFNEQTPAGQVRLAMLRCLFANPWINENCVCFGSTARWLVGELKRVPTDIDLGYIHCGKATLSPDVQHEARLQISRAQLQLLEQNADWVIASRQLQKPPIDVTPGRGMAYSRRFCSAIGKALKLQTFDSAIADRIVRVVHRNLRGIEMKPCDCADLVEWSAEYAIRNDEPFRRLLFAAMSRRDLVEEICAIAASESCIAELSNALTRVDSSVGWKCVVERIVVLLVKSRPRCGLDD